jgi:hypothetical protein
MTARLGPIVIHAWFATNRLGWIADGFFHREAGHRGSALFVLGDEHLLCFAHAHGRFPRALLVSRSKGE